MMMVWLVVILCSIVFSLCGSCVVMVFWWCVLLSIFSCRFFLCDGRKMVLVRWLGFVGRLMFVRVVVSVVGL